MGHLAQVRSRRQPDELRLPRQSPTDTAWTGTVSGSLHRVYDGFFRVVGETISGGPAVSYQYDADGLLTSAGALQIQRDPATGFQTGATLGGIIESRTFTAYCEEASYTSSFAGSNLYNVTYTRDALSRVSSKTERVGTEAAHTFSYAYDLTGRLTDVSKDGTPTAGPPRTSSPNMPVDLSL